MARRRFFVDQVHSGEAEIAGDEAQHLTRVLRVETGQIFEISDNRQVYLAEVTTARKSQVVFHVLEKLPLAAPAVRIHLLAGLIKFDHFEWMIEKVTELGVARIIPVICTRTERGLEQAANKRMERWQRIALEASQQSRRDQLPELAGPVRFRDAASHTADFRLLLDEDRSAPPILRQIKTDRTVSDSVALAIGPEGGWTPEERTQLLEAGWTAASLGPQILRAETAAIAALAVVSAAWIAK